ENVRVSPDCFAALRAPRNDRSSGSEKDADVLCRQYILVEGELAQRDLPLAVDTAEQVLPGPDIKVLLGLRPAAVDDEVRMDLELGGAVARFDIDVGDQMPGARWRVFGPGHAGVEAGDPRRQRLLGFVEDRQFLVSGQILLDIAGGVEDRDRLARSWIAVAARRHPVADVVGQQSQPLVEAALVQEPHLAIEKPLDLADDAVIHDWCREWRCRPAARPSSRPPSAAPSAGRSRAD